MALWTRWNTLLTGFRVRGELLTLCCACACACASTRPHSGQKEVSCHSLRFRRVRRFELPKYTTLNFSGRGHRKCIDIFDFFGYS